MKELDPRVASVRSFSEEFRSHCDFGNKTHDKGCGYIEQWNFFERKDDGERTEAGQLLEMVLKRWRDSIENDGMVSKRFSGSIENERMVWKRFSDSIENDITGFMNSEPVA
jgi:hypothetical protein